MLWTGTIVKKRSLNQNHMLNKKFKTMKKKRNMAQFLFAHQVVNIYADKPILLNQLQQYWKNMAVRSNQKTLPRIDICISQLPVERRLATKAFISTPSILLLQDPHKLITGIFSKKHWRIYIQYRDCKSSKAREHLLFNIFLTCHRMLLKRLGIIPLHSAMVVYKDKGILLAGVSGAGKTTTSLRLIRRGFHFISDDQILLTFRQRRFIAHSHARPLYLSQDNQPFFPELKTLWHQLPIRNLKRKKTVSLNLLDRLFPGRRKTKAGVHYLLFPHVVSSGKTALKQLNPGHAFDILLQMEMNDGTLMLQDKTAVETQLNRLSELCNKIPSYRYIINKNDSEFDRPLKRLLS